MAQNTEKKPKASLDVSPYSAYAIEQRLKANLVGSAAEFGLPGQDLIPAEQNILIGSAESPSVEKISKKFGAKK